MSEISMRRGINVVKAAKKAGYSPEERSSLISNPGQFVGDQIHPKLAEALTPSAISALFTKLEGGTAPNQELVRLGNVLYDFEKNLKDKGYDSLEPKEIKMLSFVSHLLECAMYDGTLIQIDGENAAALAFFVNRLAKLKELPGSSQEGVGFDHERFLSFVEDVIAFVDSYFSQEHIQELLEETKREKAAIRDELSETGDHNVVSFFERQNLYEQDQEERRDLVVNAYQTVQGWCNRVRLAVDKFEDIYGDDDVNAGLAREVVAFLGSITEQEAQTVFAEYMDGKNAIIGERMYSDYICVLEKLARYKGVEKFFVLNLDEEYPSNNFQDALQHVCYNLERFVEQNSGSRKPKSFKELKDQHTAQSIVDSGLVLIARELTENASSHETKDAPWGRARHLRGSIGQYKKDRPSLVAADQAIEPLVLNWKALNHKEIGLLKDWEMAEYFLKQIRESANAVERDMTSPGADLYFVKTLLIAADEKYFTHNTALGISISNTQERVQRHSFVSHSEINKRKQGASKDYYSDYYYDETPRQKTEDYYYSDVHYITAHLPFAKAVVAYFRHNN